MVLGKTYLRYQGEVPFGIITSSSCNALLLGKRPISGIIDPKKTYAICGALENVIVWDVRRNEQVLCLRGESSEAEVLALSPDQNTLAVGHADGNIRLWCLKRGVLLVNFSGHKSNVTTLAFDGDGLRLSSGSKDTEVVVWDVVNESGLYRFKGHKGPVNCCCFMKSINVLITCSKDTFVKFWDLDTQHAFLTLVGHRSEVWSFTLSVDERFLITGGTDAELKLWSLDRNALDEDTPVELSSKRPADRNEPEHPSRSPLRCVLLGDVLRLSKERVVRLTFDQSGRHLICQSMDKRLELFRFATEEGLQKSLKRRLKKARKNQQKGLDTDMNSVATIMVEDRLQRMSILRLSSKIRYVDVIKCKDGALHLLVSYKNNTVDLLRVNIHDKGADQELVGSVQAAGHRSDIRTVCFNSDGTCLLTGAAESVKVWNSHTMSCIRTIETEYCLSSLFVPGDRHAVVGTKSGKLHLLDIAGSQILETVEAHSGAVWALCLSPDKKGFVSGSASKEVKLWNFELAFNDDKTAKRLTAACMETVQMTDDILALKYSHDGRFLAIALLDTTIKVVFVDTFKLYLSLYGHKFPVLSMDISTDNTLVVSASSDKNIKLWGLDFGDCRKSIFAHDDSIMQVAFVPNTHYFFSCGKDRLVKYWDADTHELIMTLKGHQAEVWCLAVSNDGEVVASASHDKSVRLWRRTDELLVPQEERNKVLEESYELSLVEPGRHKDQSTPGDHLASAGRKTLETIRSAEEMMEAVDFCMEEEARTLEHEQSNSKTKLVPHPLLQAHGNISPLRYGFQVFEKTKSSELEEALLVLPYSYITKLMGLLQGWMKNGWDIELISRVLLFISRIHFHQLTHDPVMVQLIGTMGESVKKALRERKNVIGFNLAGMNYLRQQLESKDHVFFSEAVDSAKDRKRKRKFMVLK